MVVLLTFQKVIMTQDTSKYGQIAVDAALAASVGVSPVAAWDAVAARLFSGSPSAMRKNCPKSAFLGLAEAGQIVGISPGCYTRSKDNKRYAEAALQLLRADPTWAANAGALWIRIMAGTVKQHNSQMDVVIALWRAKRFIGQDGKYPGN
jgi:hypothetical protein